MARMNSRSRQIERISRLKIRKAELEREQTRLTEQIQRVAERLDTETANLQRMTKPPSEDELQRRMKDCTRLNIGL